jgi:4-amino-4-deoxy-L-arabinose transferase-like glycosyltransferase
MADQFHWFRDRSNWVKLPDSTNSGLERGLALEAAATGQASPVEFAAADSFVSISSTTKSPRSWSFVFCLILFVYLATCGFPHLFDQIDGQYAGAAREMMKSGNWLIPTQDGVPRLQKPPLVYWCEIGSMSLFGINEFGARFPIIVATVGWFFATGLLARRIVGSQRAAMASSLVLAMFMGSYVFNHLVMPEPFLGCFLTLSFWCLASALQVGNPPDRTSLENASRSADDSKDGELFSENPGITDEEEREKRIDRWLMGAWFFITLGAMAKGLHAFIFPVAVGAISAAFKPSSRKIWRQFLLRPHGWVLFLVLFLPWYLYTESRFPGFLKDHFLNEQFGSVIRRRWPPDSDHVSLSVFWFQHLGLFFPITLLLPGAIASTWNALRGKASWLQGEWHLLVIWFVLNAVGISFANIQDYYLMTAWPVVAIWIGWTISVGRCGSAFRFAGAGLAIFAILGFVAGLFLCTQYLFHAAPAADIGQDRDDTILNVLKGFSPTIWAEILPLIWISCGAALVTGIVLFFWCRRRQSDVGLTMLGVFMSVIFVLSARGLVIVQDEFSSAGVAKLIEANSQKNATVISQGDSNENTSLFFYLRSAIFWVDGNPEMEFATRNLGIGREHYLSRVDVARQWEKPDQVFLIIESSGLDEWRQILSSDPGRFSVLGWFGSRVVLSNGKPVRTE